MLKYVDFYKKSNDSDFDHALKRLSVFSLINIHSLISYFPAYARLASTREALLVPLLAAALFLRFGPSKPLPKQHGLVFLFALMFSVVFSIHYQHNGVNALYAIPGYALIIQLLPSDQQPSWPDAFALSFFSLLLTDIWCSASWHLSAGALPGNFYEGIGGAGWHDLLFIGPWLAAAPLALKDSLTRRGIADKTLSECGKAIKDFLLNKLYRSSL